MRGLITRTVEYITAIRCELERKRLVAEDPESNKVRIAELACYMTLCGMESGHKFLACKVAMNLCYKMENNVTAAHFARAILDLEPTGIFANKPETINQFRKYYNAFSQKGTNAHKLQFNPQDTAAIVNLSEAGYICAGSLTILEDSRAVATVKCPLCGSVCARPAFADKICETCQLCHLGKDVMGLSIKLEVAAEAQEAPSNDFLL